MPLVFQPSKTPLYRVVLFDRFLPTPLRLGVLLSCTVLSAFSTAAFLGSGEDAFLGVAALGAGAALALFLFELFLRNSLSYVSLKHDIPERVSSARTSSSVFNIADYISFSIAKVVFSKKSNDLRAIFIELLKNKRLDFVYARLSLNRQAVLARLRTGQELRTTPELFLKTMERAAVHAARSRHLRIYLMDILKALTRADFAFRKILFEHGLEERDFDRVLHWEDALFHEVARKKRFWRRENLMRIRGFGSGWAAGYTPTLDLYSKDITAIIERGGWDVKIVSHKDEISAIEQVLARTGENNALLVSDSDVEKESVVYGFAKRVLEGRSLSSMNRKRVVELDMQSLMSGLETAREIEERIRQIFMEAWQAKNIILVISDLHQFIHAQSTAGALDISPAIIPFIKTSAIQLVTTTTYEGLHRNIEKNQQTLGYFEKIEIMPPDRDAMFAVIADIVPLFEQRHKIFFTFESVKAAIELSDRYIQDMPFPEKVIDILGDTAVYTGEAGKKIVVAQDIADVLSQRIQIPLGDVTREESDKLLRLEQTIHERVIGQDEAVHVIAEAMRRERAGVRATIKRPIGTFLFLGPTGVGKTETAKALAHAYFGDENRMIRFDMTEYQLQGSLDRLIGSASTNEEGALGVSVREDPFSLILLDEIEKAHPKILDLFLQIFDEGEARDGWGKKLMFNSTIIIATSNAGAELIRQSVKGGESHEALRAMLVEEVLRQGIFRPEFLNRFDAVVVFTPLGREEVLKIATLKVKKLSEKLYREKGIRLEISEEALARLAELGFNQAFGARELNRVLAERVEGELAAKILSGKLARGDTFVYQG